MRLRDNLRNPKKPTMGCVAPRPAQEFQATAIHDLPLLCLTAALPALAEDTCFERTDQTCRPHDRHHIRQSEVNLPIAGAIEPRESDHHFLLEKTFGTGFPSAAAKRTPQDRRNPVGKRQSLNRTGSSHSPSHEWKIALTSHSPGHVRGSAPNKIALRWCQEEYPGSLDIILR